MPGSHNKCPVSPLCAGMILNGLRAISRSKASLPWKVGALHVPFLQGACPRSGSRRGKGPDRNPRGGPVCASSPPRQGRGPGKPRLRPRKDDGQWAVGLSGRPPRASPAGLEHPARGRGDAGTFQNLRAQPGARRAPHAVATPPERARPLRGCLTAGSHRREARARTRQHSSARAHEGARSPASQDETEGMESSSWFENRR